ncbi:hypothetical protein ES705_07463 [subsurface metagenome]
MGKNAWKKVEKKFNSDLYYQKLLEIYKRAIAIKRRNFREF